MAKFEVCGHYFADLSERGYGVGLLNDSKYGYTAIDNVLSLSLLRFGNFHFAFVLLFKII